MTFSIIQKSQLEGVKRLDAEYYQPEYLDLSGQLRKMKSILLKDYSVKINRGKQPIYSGNGNVLALKSVYIRDSFIDDLGDEFVDENYYNKNSKSQIKKFDVLLNSTGVGTLGRSSYYYLDKKAVADGHVTIIRTKKELDPIYLDVFLKTKYGQFQINRLYSGSSGQIEIYPDNIGLIEIFLPKIEFQGEISSVCKDAHDLEDQLKKLYKQAEDILLDELKIKDLDLSDEAGFTVNLSEVKEIGRCDAEYFQPKYKKLIGHIKKNCNGAALGDLVSVKKGIEPGAEEYLAAIDDEGLENGKGGQFIRVSSLSKFGVNDNDQKYLSEKLYQELKDDFEPKKGEILLTKDASPGVAYVLKENIEGIISGGILRLKIKNQEIEDEYLALCVNSVIGRMQAERDAGGSIIAHWKPEQIKNMAIPILPKPIQQEISGLIRQSHDARKKAKELLEEAKRKVEELIENK